MPNYKQAGRINGNPLCGLNERVCIAVKRVFDGNRRRYSGDSFSTQVNIPAGFTPPYTFVEARQSGETVVSALTVTALDNGRTRYSFVTTVPLTISFTDGVGARGSGYGEIVIPRDVVFNTPGEAVFPYELEATTGVYANVGSFSGETATFTVCALQIIRLTARVELLVPSYGYCEYPDATDDEDRCRGLFELPLFPT